jgi:molybdopterin converting factor subunit 1
MRINVIYFAVFKDKAGLSSEVIDFDGKTTKQLFLYISERYQFLDSQANCKVAVNNVIVDWDYNLSEKDEVLLFPPVAGG